MSLLTERFVQEIAFEWDSTKRVYQADTLTVEGDEEKDVFRLANGDVVSNFQKLWLIYDVRFRFLKRISPSGDSGNDFVDLRNALIDANTTVTLYPIHDVDATVTETVLLTDRGVDILTIDRWYTRPEFRLELISSTSKQSYPTWLRNTYS